MVQMNFVILVDKACVSPFVVPEVGKGLLSLQSLLLYLSQLGTGQG